MKWNDLSMADRAAYIKLGLDNGVTNLKVIRDTYNKYAEGGPFRPRPKAVPKGHSLYNDPQWYEEHKEDVEAHKREMAERERKHIERKLREANKAESQFNSYRRATEQLSKHVQEPVFKENSLKQAADTQYQKNLNTWQPVLDTADLGLNIATMYSGNPALFGASMLTNGIQLGDNIKDNYKGEAASLFFDTIGLLGSTNRLPNIKFRRYTFNTDKAADYIGAGWNMIDSGNDIYELGKFGYKYHNTSNPNLIFEPFSR